MGKTNPSLIEDILFENSRLKTAGNRQLLIDSFLPLNHLNAKVFWMPR
jgi:hypothetical protein